MVRKRDAPKLGERQAACFYGFGARGRQAVVETGGERTGFAAAGAAGIFAKLFAS